MYGYQFELKVDGYVGIHLTYIKKDHLDMTLVSEKFVDKHIKYL